MKKRTTKCKLLGADLFGRTTNGHPQFIYNLRATEDGIGPDARKAGEEFRMFRTCVAGFKEVALKELAAFGMTNDDLRNPVGLGDAIVTCQEEYEEYQGEWRWKGKWINPLKTAKKTATLSEDEVEDFVDEMAALFGNVERITVTDENRATEDIY